MMRAAIGCFPMPETVVIEITVAISCAAITTLKGIPSTGRPVRSAERILKRR